jgi:dihydropteroate synthase
MAATCAALGCGAILMHTRGRPQQWRTQPPLAASDVLPLVLGGLLERAQAALAAGIAHDSIVLDPGFGFGKAFDENYPLLAQFDALHGLGFPLLAGLSRKSFLTRAAASRPAPDEGVAYLTALSSELEIPGAEEPALSLPKGPDVPTWDLATSATTAANTAAILAGAHILRVHDVLPARQAAAIADRILTAGGVS